MEKLRNRWSDEARAASAASRLAKYGSMMGLKPWGDAARAAAAQVRAQRAKLAEMGYSFSDEELDRMRSLPKDYSDPYAKPGITSRDEFDRRNAEYGRAFRDYASRLNGTLGKIAGFHAVVGGLGVGGAAAARSYRQATGVRPVVAASGKIGRVGRYFTGKSPVYDSEGVLAGWARGGGRPYARGFNGIARQPMQKAGGVGYERTGKVYDPATGKASGRVRYSPEDGAEQGVFKGRRYGDRGSEVAAMEQYANDMAAARDAGYKAAKSGIGSFESGLKAGGYLAGSEVSEAFRDGWREGKYEAARGPLMSVYKAFESGIDAFRDGVPAEEAALRLGVAEDSGLYGAILNGWGSAQEAREAVSAVKYDAGVGAYRDGKSLEQTARELGISYGTESYRILEKGFNDAGGVDDAGGNGDDAEPGGDPYWEEYGRYLDERDALWEEGMRERFLDRDGYPLGQAAGKGSEVREALAQAYGGDYLSLGRELRAAVTSKTAKDAARGLGLLHGQWGGGEKIVNQVPPTLLGDYEAGLKEGKAGYDYGIRAPVDRAAVVRRANAFIGGRLAEDTDDDPVGGFWPEHLTGKNQDEYVARRMDAGGSGGEGSVALLRAAMEWLGNSLAANDKPAMNAALSYIADTLAEIQADGRNRIAREASGAAADNEGEGEDDGADTGVDEFDEDGNEVPEESAFYEDSYADPDAVPPWDFERVPDFGLKNRWSDAARAASAASRLAKYGAMMGLKPWGAAARAAAAAARGFGRSGRSSGGRGSAGRGGRSSGGGGTSGGGSRKGGVSSGGSSGGRGGGGSVPGDRGRGTGDYAGAVESYGENGIDGMTDGERAEIFEEIRERSEAGETLTDQDKKFLVELEAFLDRELGIGGKKEKGGGWKAKQDPEQKPNAFLPLDAYDDRIAEAEEEGDRAKARRLRREKNRARKSRDKQALAEKAKERRESRSRSLVLSDEDDNRMKAHLAESKKVPQWEYRGGTPAVESLYYAGDGYLRSSSGKVIGKAPKTQKEGAFFWRGRWFDAKTGKAIASGYQS